MVPIIRKAITVPLEVIEECGCVGRRYNFEETKLYGRSKEVKILQDAFRRIHRGNSEVILVRGLPGMGKTKLVEEALRKFLTGEGHSGFLVTGRYDSLHNGPFSAIRSALSDLIGHIIKSRRRKVTQNMIMEKFSVWEIMELVHFLPNLILLARCETLNQKEIVCASNASTRFRILLRSLIQTLITSDRPVALFLDDIQWIDEDSRLLLNALVQDPTSRNMLLICSTRELAPSEKTFPGSQSGIPTTELRIGSMDLEAVTEMVSDIFQIDEAELLSDVVLRKSSGNMFKIANILTMIQREEQSTLASKGWVHFVKEEQERLLSYGSFDDLLDRKIRQLSSEVHEVLKVASCLGQHFHFDLLVHVCRSKNGKSWDHNVIHVNRALDAVVHLGYLEKSAQSYAFTSDYIRQLWYDMIQKDHDAGEIHLEIGVAVRSYMIIEQDLSLLFLAAGNVGLGCQSRAGNNLLLGKQVLELLHDASQKAAGYGAFSQAKSCVEAALRLLKSEQHHWKKRYNLSRNLYSHKIAIEMSLGIFDEAHVLAEELLAHSCCFDDSISALYLIIECLGCSGKYMEALQNGFLVLGDLGEVIPKSNRLFHLRREHVKIRRALQNMSDEAVLCLPFIRCKRMVAVMQILGLLMRHSYLIPRDKLDATSFFLLGLRIMTLSLRYGLHETSCLGFSCYGIIESVTGNSHDVGRYGRLALQLITKLGAERMEAMVMYMQLEHVMHSQQSWIECRDALSHIYPKALTTGDMDCAFQLANRLILSVSFYDVPLSRVENEIAGYCELMKEYGHDATFNMSVALWQRTHNYLGFTKDAVILTGAVMEESTTLCLLKKCGHYAAVQVLNITKLGLALFFESWCVAASLIPSIQRNMAQMKMSHMFQYECNFVFAASCMALYRETRRRRYRFAALRATKQLRKWDTSGVEVCTPMVMFLRAEWALTYGMETAPRLFLEAAGGFASLKCLLNFQALAYERIGRHYLACQEHDRATDFYAMAIAKYEEWEAVAKVNQLRNSVVGIPRSSD